jgi:hypothetical protein
VAQRNLSNLVKHTTKKVWPNCLNPGLSPLNAWHLGQSGVNFTNILKAAFSYKFFVQLLCAYNLGLQFFGERILARKDFGAKAAHKMLVKLTPEPNAIKGFFPVNTC